MKNTVLRALLVLFITFGFTIVSCSDESVGKTNIEVEENISQEVMSNLFNSARTAISTNQESEYVEEGECYTINYPYSVSDGVTSTTLNSDDEFYDFLENLDYNSNFYIEVPFDITFADGSQQTITSYEDLEIILNDCYGDDFNDDSECFELNFPLTALDNQDNQVIVYSEQDLYNFEFMGFVYPIYVTLTDGTQVTINDPNEFDTLYNDCYDIEDCEDCEEQCFKIVFPFSFVSNSGTVVTFNGYDELLDFLNQLTEEDFYVISYPLTVQFEDGTQQTANSDEELEALYERCE